MVWMGARPLRNEKNNKNTERERGGYGEGILELTDGPRDRLVLGWS